MILFFGNNFGISSVTHDLTIYSKSDLQIIKMNSKVIEILIVLTVVGRLNCEDDEKIVGGEVINISQAPYQGALLYAGSFICGCSIISTKYLLTAAHCVHDFRDRLSVRVGSAFPFWGGELFEVEQAIKHPLFNIDTLNHDFAILKLKNEITMQTGVKEIIKLPQVNDKIENGKEVFVSGYGSTMNPAKEDRLLRGVLVPIVPQNICKRSYPTLLTAQMICAGLKEGGKDSCSVSAILITKQYFQIIIKFFFSFNFIYH